MIRFDDNNCAPRNWLDEKLCPGKKVTWVAKKIRITWNEFTTEAWILLTITCSRVSPCTNMTYIPIFQDQMVDFLLDNISFNVGWLVLSDIRNYKNRGGLMLMFLSCITELCKGVEVEKYPREKWVSLNTPIFPLKICGENALSKGKK